MNLSLDNIDLNSNPYAGTEQNSEKTLRVLGAEAAVVRQQSQPQLAQIGRDMRCAVGFNGFHPELRRAVQTFIQFRGEVCWRPPFGQSILTGGKGFDPVCVVASDRSGNGWRGHGTAKCGRGTGENHTGSRDVYRWLQSQHF